MNQESLTKALLSVLVDRVSDRVFDTLCDVICEETHTLLVEQTPEWVKALPEDEQLELQYELAQRIVLTYV